MPQLEQIAGQELERLLTYELAKILAASGVSPSLLRSGAPRHTRKDEKTGEPKFLVVGASETHVPLFSHRCYFRLTEAKQLLEESGVVEAIEQWQTAAAMQLQCPGPGLSRRSGDPAEDHGGCAARQDRRDQFVSSAS